MESLSKMSDVVFHATNLFSTVSILQSNEFALTTSMGTEADDALRKNKLFYLSTTRHKLGKYHKYKGNEFVLLTLDGTKFNERYESKPVDYWGENFRKEAQGDYEAEDRLFSNDPSIPHARKYIIQIDVLLKNTEHFERVKQFLMLAKKYKIPHYIYKEEKDFGIKSKAIKIDVKTLTGEKYERYDPTKYFDRSKKIDKSVIRRYRSDYVWNMQELVHKVKWAKLSKEAQGYIYNMVYDSFNEKYTTFKNDVHNDKTSNRSNIAKINDLMKKTKSKTLRELYNFVLNKWKPVLLEGRE